MDIKDFEENNYVIRKMSLPHCARGSKGCVKCTEAAKNVHIYLLEVYFDPGTITRPVIQVNIRGEKIWQVYDVIKEFKSNEEAKEYAKKKGFKLIEESTRDGA